MGYVTPAPVMVTLNEVVNLKAKPYDPRYGDNQIQPDEAFTEMLGQPTPTRYCHLRRASSQFAAYQVFGAKCSKPVKSGPPQSLAVNIGFFDIQIQAIASQAKQYRRR